MCSIRVVFVRWLHVTIVVVVLRRWLSLAATSLSILLGDPRLKLVNGALFKLFPLDFFVSEPGIFSLTIFVHVVITVRLLSRGLRMILTAFCVSLIFSVRTCHIEHDII